MSGNGTRIAARWLAEQTGADDVTVRVGPREVRARMLADGLVEQELGPVVVGEPEEVEGIRFTPVDVGNPHAVVDGDPAELDRIGPLLETHPHFPNRTNVQVARRIGAATIEARVWERGVGETGASGTSAIAVVAALGGGEADVRFPGGDAPRPARRRPGASHRQCGARNPARRSILMGMRVRLVVGLLLAGAVVLPAQASAATFRTFPVPTGGLLDRAAVVVDRHHEGRALGARATREGAVVPGVRPGGEPERIAEADRRRPGREGHRLHERRCCPPAGALLGEAGRDRDRGAAEEDARAEELGVGDAREARRAGPRTGSTSRRRARRTRPTSTCS